MPSDVRQERRVCEEGKVLLVSMMFDCRGLRWDSMGPCDLRHVKVGHNYQ